MSINELLIHKAVCRTAPATPGLLIFMKCGKTGKKPVRKGEELLC